MIISWLVLDIRFSSRSRHALPSLSTFICLLLIFIIIHIYELFWDFFVLIWDTDMCRLAHDDNFLIHFIYGFLLWHLSCLGLIVIQWCNLTTAAILLSLFKIRGFGDKHCSLMLIRFLRFLYAKALVVSDENNTGVLWGADVRGVCLYHLCLDLYLLRDGGVSLGDFHFVKSAWRGTWLQAMQIARRYNLLGLIPLTVEYLLWCGDEGWHGPLAWDGFDDLMVAAALFIEVTAREHCVKPLWCLLWFFHPCLLLDLS